MVVFWQGSSEGIPVGYCNRCLPPYWCSPFFSKPPPVEIQGRVFDLGFQKLGFVFMMVGVKVIFCDGLSNPIDRNLVVTTSLLHLLPNGRS